MPKTHSIKCPARTGQACLCQEDKFHKTQHSRTCPSRIGQACQCPRRDDGKRST